MPHQTHGILCLSRLSGQAWRQSQNQVDSQENSMPFHQQALLGQMILFPNTERPGFLPECQSKYFEIKIEKTKEYYNNALLIQKDNISFHNFTSKIHKNYDYEKKLDIIEMLWEVVLVDKIVHDFESNLMRRIAGLLHIKDLDNGRIRKKVLNKLS